MQLLRRRRSSSALEEGWHVGGKYKVNRPIPLFNSLEFSEPVAKLRSKEVVLLLAVQHDSRWLFPRGLVAMTRSGGPGSARTYGWVELEDGEKGKGPIQKQRLEHSWEVRARYAVKVPCELRAAPLLNSELVGEVPPGDEVLVLRFSLHEIYGEPCLQMLVACDSGAIGWISPETPDGEEILSPVNLLGKQVLALHRSSVMSGTPPRSSVNSAPCDGPELPGELALASPWEVGGKYQVLEALSLRPRPDPAARFQSKLRPGNLVLVSDVHSVSCAPHGACHWAFVVVGEGPDQGKQGWVRCSAPDGHDLLDTRDQLEYDKIMSLLKQQDTERNHSSSSSSSSSSSASASVESDGSTATATGEQGRRREAEVDVELAAAGRPPDALLAGGLRRALAGDRAAREPGASASPDAPAAPKKLAEAAALGALGASGAPAGLEDACALEDRRALVAEWTTLEGHVYACCGCSPRPWCRQEGATGCGL